MTLFIDFNIDKIDLLKIDKTALADTIIPRK
jgi:hypothetical protein